MSLSDSPTLSALIAAYEKAVVFEEATPHAFRLAKLFSEMHRARGGLVLLGVSADGQVTGVDPDHLDAVYTKFGRLCAALTDRIVEMGTLHLGGRLVVFLVFNPIPQHTDPLERYAESMSRLASV